jgi:putative ABC transport system permease protein
MFGYYVALALRGLKRNIALTILTIATLGVGIAASMTMLAIYRGYAIDPIPGRSTQLYVPQLDSWGPVRANPGGYSDQLPELLSYTDVQGLLRSRVPQHQAAMYETRLIVTPPDQRVHPFEVRGRAADADFFAMFEVPWLFGVPWTAAEDLDRAHVVVISRELNDRLFDGRNSVGAALKVNDLDYRVVGVMNNWQPLPRFYDLGGGAFRKVEDVFIPFTAAIAQQQPAYRSFDCNVTVASGWDDRLHGDCVWLQLWVELPTAAAARAYRTWLASYAAEQQRIGRFRWAARTQLRNVRQWIAYHELVSGEERLLLVVSFSFLFLCLVNATSLMLAKILGAAGDIAVRRALGARRLAVLMQCLVETGVVGFLGGLVGLLLTALCMLGLQRIASEAGQQLVQLDTVDVALTVLLAVVSTMLAGLYPTLRAVYSPPAPQLKAL